MDMGRRDVLLAAAGASASAALGMRGMTGSPPAQDMYGLISKMTTVAGQRDALIAILLEGTVGMPGCLSYVVARDPADANAIWITEVWENQASHGASLSLPGVQQAMARGKPLIAGFDHRTVTSPVGGQGLPSAH